MLRKIITIFILVFMTSTNSFAENKTAIFAGGCFWCMQPVFDSEDGVSSTIVGFSGGDYANPTYDDLHTKDTGHYEAIQVTYDPAKVEYSELLKIYWANIDPFDKDGQFADKGHEYHTVIFYADDEQKSAAEKSKTDVSKKFDGKEVATQILPAKTFYPAEEYHQKFYQKNSDYYNSYKHGSGRFDGLKEIWNNK